MEAASRALLRRLVAPPPTAAPLHLARMFRHSGIHVKRSLVARGGWCSRRLSTGKVEHRDSQGSRPAAAGAADAAGSADAESFLKQLAQHHSEKGDVEVVVDRDGGLVFNPLPEPDPEAARRMGRHQLRAYLAEVTGVEPVEVGKSGGAKPKAKQPATAAGSPAATGEDDGLGFMPEMAVPGKVEESEDEIVEFNLGKAMATLLEDDDVGTEGQGDSSDHVSAADIAWMRRHFGDAYVDSYLSEDPTEQELEARSVTVERTRRPKGFGFSPVTHKAAEAADINRRGRGRGARAQRVAVIDQGLQELDLLNTRSESGDGGVPKRLRAKLPSVKAAAGPRQYSEIFSVFPHLDDEESGGLGDGFRPDLGAAEDEFDSEADRKMAEFVPRRRFMRRQLYKPQTLMQRKTSTRLQTLLEAAYGNPKVRAGGANVLSKVSPTASAPQIEAVYVTPCLKDAEVFWSLPWDSALDPTSAVLTDNAQQGSDELQRAVRACERFLESSRRQLHQMLAKGLRRKPPRLKFVFADADAKVEEEYHSAVDNALAELERQMRSES